MIFTSGDNRIACMDVLDYLSGMADECTDLIIADPPYYRVWGKFDFRFKSEQEYMDWCRKWLLECRRVLKRTGTLILFGSLGKRQITFARLAIMIEDEKIFVRQNWITQRNTRGVGTSRNYISAREDILFLTKGNEYTFNIPYLEERNLKKDMGANGKPRKNKFKRVTNVWCDIAEASQSSIERCAHPTVKALKLCDRLILAHSRPDDLIFVPFAGSGSECIAAIRNGRLLQACEKEPSYIKLAIERIEKFTGVVFGKLD